MKALSIKQPWAWAILHMGKLIENRTWPTSYRGEFFIHASKTFDTEGYLWLCNNQFRLGYSERFPAMNDSSAFPLGGIVGIGELTDCVKKHASPWFFGPYGFLIRNPRPIVPLIPLRGERLFFDVNECISESARAFIVEAK